MKASDVEAFAESHEGTELAALWGKDAAKNVATIRGRVGVVPKSLGAADGAKAEVWIDSLASAQARAVWQALIA